MASFEKTAHGTVRAHVCIDGQRDSQSFDSKDEALRWALQREDALREQKRTGLFPGYTVGNMFKRYAEEISPTKKGARYEILRLDLFARQEFKVEGRLVRFAALPLCEVSSVHVAAFRDHRARTITPGSVNRELNLLSHCFAIARKEWHWIKDSPTHDVKRPRNPPPRQRRISEAELDRLCYCLGYEPGAPVRGKTPQVAIAVLFAIETAMRAGEILRLQRGEHAHGTVAYVARQGGAAWVHLPDSKNGHPRQVPLSPPALALLAELPLTGAAYFNLDTALLDALFRKATRAAGIDNLNFHDTRHEAISRLCKRFDVLELARVVGHRNLKELMTYYHPDIRELAAKLA